MESESKDKENTSDENEIKPATENNENDTSETSQPPENSNNNILKNIGNFFITILASIGLGLLNFIKSNWLVLLIIGSIIYGLYYLYSNATNFINTFLNIFKNIQPVLKSSVDILDSTISKTPSDTTNSSTNISSIQKSSNNSNSDDTTSLESKLKPRKQDKDLENSDDEDDVNHEHNEDHQHSDIETTNDKKTSTFNVDNLSKSNNNDTTGLEGYCFIGNDNGIRSCAPIGKNNKCMSGDIFPTMEICMNPKLRE